MFALLLTGCSYEAEKALRKYNYDLEPVRILSLELERYQPRISDKTSHEKIRAYVQGEILPRAKKIQETLISIRALDPRIEILNDRLLDIWSVYAMSFEGFAEDLTADNLEHKRRKVFDSLENCDFNWKTWNAELQSFHSNVMGWAG